MMMRQFSLALWIGLGLVGCVSPKPYGYAINGTVPSPLLEQLAQETVTRMEALYPPAHTRLALTHPATDPYGLALIEVLRLKGYGVRESRVTTRTTLSTRADMQTPGEPVVNQDEGIPLRYVVDGPFEPRLYRLTVFIGNQSLSRVYHMDEQTMAQAGAWVRKE
ncbi:MAG: conjugal transfer protein TrbH [Nitrospira sp.]|nr:conjugal transfer protein TrbH [Nitrospira sp.]